MTIAPITRNSLILRLRDREDAEAWREFVDIYQPVIYRVAIRRGMQHADAMELVQRVLLAIARAVERFQPDPDRARFRSWLFTITHNEFCKAFNASRKFAATGNSEVQRLLDAAPQPESDDDFTIEYRRSVFRWAAERVKPQVKPSTWDAFWRSSVDEEPIDQVAAELGLSVGAIYIARSRVMARLQEQAALFEEHTE